MVEEVPLYDERKMRKLLGSKRIVIVIGLRALYIDTIRISHYHNEKIKGEQI
jgi:hypothetical protein